MLTSSSNVKLDNSKETAFETDLDSLRSQNYRMAYHSLIASAQSRYEGSDNTKAQAVKQFNTTLGKQNVIASRLDAQTTQTPVPAINEPNIISSIQVLRQELADIRKQIQATQNAVKYSKVDIAATQAAIEVQQRKGLRQSDLDDYDRKIVHHEDLDHYTKRREFLSIEDKFNAQKSTVMSWEKKLSELAAVTGERHREGKEIQERNTLRLERLDLDIGDMRAKQSQVEKILDTQNEESITERARLSELQDNLARLDHAIQGSAERDENILIENTKHTASQLAQTIDSVTQVTERMTKLEELRNTENHNSSANLSDNSPDVHSELATLRKEFDIFIEEQRKEYDCVVDDMGQLENRIKYLQDEATRTKDDNAKQHIQSPFTSTHPPNVLHPDNITNNKHINCAKLETDYQAIVTQLFVLKKHFENLTTEHLAHNIINQTKQLYSEHPGHVQDKLIKTDNHLSGIDRYITQTLENRLRDMQLAINGRATNDMIQALSHQIQLQASNNQICRDHATQTRKDLSEHLDVSRKDLMNQIAPLENERQSTILKLESTSKRLDGLQEGFETLTRNVDSRTGTDGMKHKSLPPSLENGNRRLISNGFEQAGGEEVGNALSSSRGDSVVRILDENTASSVLETPNALPSGAERKRKSFATLTDSEDDCEPRSARKAVRRKEK